MKSLFLSALLSFSACALAAQSVMFQETFGSTGNEYPFCVNTNSDNGLVISGYTNGPGTDSTDALVIRTDANGDTLWERTYGSVHNDAFLKGMQTMDGNFVFLGNTGGFNCSGGDAWIVKTDPAGNVLWSKTYGESQYSDQGFDMKELPDAGFVVLAPRLAGSFAGDVVLMRLNSIGDTLWTERLNMGMSFPNSIDVRANGDIVIGGTFLDDLYCLCFDAGGNYLWGKKYPVPLSGYLMPMIVTCRPASDNGFILSGAVNVQSDSNSVDMLLLKTDSTGTPQWCEAIRQSMWSAGGEDWPTNLTPTSDGGYTMSGIARTFTMGYENYVVHTNAAGAVQWSKFYGGASDERMSSSHRTNDPVHPLCDNTWRSFGTCNPNGEVLLTSWTGSFTPGNSTDVYVLKTDDQGNSGCNEWDAQSIAMPYTVSPQNILPLFLSSGYSLQNVTPTVSDPHFTRNNLCTNVSIEEHVVPVVKLFPDPAITELHIELADAGNNELEIFNALGEKIYTGKFVAGKATVDVSGFANGIYLLRVNDENTIVAQKFVKQ